LTTDESKLGTPDKKKHGYNSLFAAVLLCGGEDNSNSRCHNAVSWARARAERASTKGEDSSGDDDGMLLEQLVHRVPRHAERNLVHVSDQSLCVLPDFHDLRLMLRCVSTLNVMLVPVYKKVYTFMGSLRLIFQTPMVSGNYRAKGISSPHPNITHDTHKRLHIKYPCPIPEC
jgi:hypothetical protein